MAKRTVRPDLNMHQSEMGDNVFQNKHHVSMNHKRKRFYERRAREDGLVMDIFNCPRRGGTRRHAQQQGVRAGRNARPDQLGVRRFPG